MKHNFRQFMVYDCEIGARKEGAVVPEMTAVAGVWQKMAERPFPILGGDATLLLGEVGIDNALRIATLLVRLSDKLSPNSVYSDVSAGTFQEHHKGANQGADFASHVLISTAPERQAPNIYTCAVEKIPGLSPDLIRRLLSKLLNYEYHDNPDFHRYPDPAGGQDREGNQRMKRCCPHVEMRARPSDAFVNDISNGRLTGVSLIRTEAVQPIGGAAFLTKHSSELKLSVNHNNLPANLWADLKSAFRRNSKEYPRAKVSIKLPDSTRQVTIQIDAENGSILDDGYIRTFDLTNISPLLAQSARRIVPHLRDLAVPQLLALRDV